MNKKNNNVNVKALVSGAFFVYLKLDSDYKQQYAYDSNLNY